MSDESVSDAEFMSVISLVPTIKNVAEKCKDFRQLLFAICVSADHSDGMPRDVWIAKCAHVRDVTNRETPRMPADDWPYPASLAHYVDDARNVRGGP